MSSDDFRRFFQEVKRMTLEQFTKKMNVMHSNAFDSCYRRMKEALYIALDKKDREEVLKKFEMIVKEWDGIKEIVVDLQAISEADFIEVVKENRRIGYDRMIQIVNEHCKNK
jgi:phosphoribosylaminoimidazole carboxylase (NCAIR synthetase)